MMRKLWKRYRYPTWLLLLISWLLLFVPAGNAHANLAQAIPSPNTVLTTPPVEVAIWFSEPIETKFSQIRVFNSNGQQVDDQNMTIKDNLIRVTLPTLPQGIYTVAWKNVSTVDGHPSEGSYLFSIGLPFPQQTAPATNKPSLVSSWAEPLVRALVLWSGLVIVGGFIFHWLVIGQDIPGRAITQRLFGFIWLAITLFLLASLLQLWLQARVVQTLAIDISLSQSLADLLSKTFWGRAWSARLVIWLLLGLGLALKPGSRWLAFLGSGLLITISLTSHAAATAQITTATLFNDIAHLLAAGLWVGGLIHFALCLPIWWQMPGRERQLWLATIVPRFSTLAILSVGTLIITGLYAAWSQFLTLAAWQTPYGLVLFIKSILIVPLLLLGAYNLLWVSPRLADQAPAGEHLRRSVRAEAVLATLVLMTVGLLASLEPARQLAAREGLGQKPVSFQDSIEGANIVLQIIPGRVGINQVIVALTDRQGQPINNATDLELTFTYRGNDLPPLSGQAIASDEGQYQLNTLNLNLTGIWETHLVLRRPDAFDGETSFRFIALNPSPPSLTPSRQLGLTLWGAEWLLLGLLFFGVALWRNHSRLSWTWLPGIAGLLAGLLLLFAPVTGSDQPSTNPIITDAASLETGQVLYAQKCIQCHGPAGLGDGPLATSLTPPPANLQTHIPLHDDQQLYSFIAGGFPNSAMVGFADQLTSKEIWHLVNYLKTLPPTSP